MAKKEHLKRRRIVLNVLPNPPNIWIKYSRLDIDWDSSWLKLISDEIDIDMISIKLIDFYLYYTYKLIKVIIKIIILFINLGLKCTFK
jgi:hypothetical protein